MLVRQNEAHDYNEVIVGKIIGEWRDNAFA